jgi:membrane protease subunit HflC
MKIAVSIIVAVVVVIAAVLVLASLYVVHEGEQVVIVQLGRPVGDPVTEPGLHVKKPFIQEVRRFEERLLVWDGEPNQIPTKGREFIWVDTTARWRIADAKRFLESVATEQGAQSRLNDIIDAQVRNAVSSSSLVELVRSLPEEDEDAAAPPVPQENAEAEQPPAEDVPAEEVPDEAAEEAADEEAAEEPPLVGEELPERGVTQREGWEQVVGPGEDATDRLPEEITRGREEITRVILAKAREIVPQYGIELIDVRIKRLDYVESVREKVYTRMISERKRIAAQFRSEGEGQSAEILGEMEKELRRIRSTAYRRVQQIRGQADAQATKIYGDAYSSDPEFYAFLRTLETYEEKPNSDATLVITTDSDFYRYLKKAQPEQAGD